MTRKMVVDWSVLMHMNWHKMRSPNFQARTGLEVAEFARNIVGHALYLVERVKPDVLILATDPAKNWRSDVYARYYRDNVEFFQYLLGAKTWVVQFDRKTFLVKYRADMGKWEYKKLAKADTAALLLDDPLQWKPWRSSKVESVPDVEPVPYVQDSEDWEALEHIIPKYKGNRATSRWEYETPKSEFKSLGANLAFNVAGVLGGHAVRVDMAEGDDICATFVGMAGETDEVYLVTIDTDLHQLLISRPDLRIFDPMKSAWVSKSQERAKFELTHKILKGDTADNICGISLRGASTTLGDKTAEKVISEHGGPDGVWSYLTGETYQGKPPVPPAADAAPLDRNLELVALNRIPLDLLHAVQDALHVAMGSPIPPSYPLEDFGLTQADLLSIRTSARLDRELDEGLREGAPAWENLPGVEA